MKNVFRNLLNIFLQAMICLQDWHFPQYFKEIKAQHLKIKLAHWADKFSRDALWETLLIICNKIVYGYIVDARRSIK